MDGRGDADRGEPKRMDLNTKCGHVLLLKFASQVSLDKRRLQALEHTSAIAVFAPKLVCVRKPSLVASSST